MISFLVHLTPTMGRKELHCRPERKKFSRTVNDGTDDLVDLAIPCRVCACEPSRQSRSKVALDGLEGALDGRRPAER